MTPEQFVEWAAFERIEGASHERMHAQAEAIGGAILYQLQVIGYYLASLLADPDSGEKPQPPKVPKSRHLDPLAPQHRGQRPSVVSEPPEDTSFVSPAVAAMLLKSHLSR